MPDANVSLDAEVDADAGFRSFMTDAVVKLHLGLNDTVQELRKWNRRQEILLANLPNYITFPLSSVNATSVDLLDYQTPQPGRQWIVKRWTCSVSPIAANAAVAGLYVGMKTISAPTLIPSDLVWGFASLPGFTTFTGQTVKVLPGQRLMVGLTSIPATSTIYSLVTVDDQPLYNAYEPVSTV